MSIFISTLTLTAIAVDRYFVIVSHSPSINANDRMSMRVRWRLRWITVAQGYGSLRLGLFKVTVGYCNSPPLQRCLTIIVSIWVVSFSLVFPYAIHMKKVEIADCDMFICTEDWSNKSFRFYYGMIVMVLQVRYVEFRPSVFLKLFPSNFTRLTLEKKERIVSTQRHCFCELQMKVGWITCCLFPIQNASRHFPQNYGARQFWQTTIAITAPMSLSRTKAVRNLATLARRRQKSRPKSARR